MPSESWFGPCSLRCSQHFVSGPNEPRTGLWLAEWPKPHGLHTGHPRPPIAQGPNCAIRIVCHWEHIGPVGHGPEGGSSPLFFCGGLGPGWGCFRPPLALRGPRWAPWGSGPATDRGPWVGWAPKVAVLMGFRRGIYHTALGPVRTFVLEMYNFGPPAWRLLVACRVLRVAC